MKPVQLLALLLLGAGCTQAPAQNNMAAPVRNNQTAPEQALQPDPVMRPEVTQDALMDRIERDLRMPEEAMPLAAYNRYYAWQQRADGMRKVTAVYVGARGRNGERHWVAESALPVIDDGGCDVISLSYDVASQRIERIGCNGYA